MAAGVFRPEMLFGLFFCLIGVITYYAWPKATDDCKWWVRTIGSKRCTTKAGRKYWRPIAAGIFGAFGLRVALWGGKAVVTTWDTARQTIRYTQTSSWLAWLTYIPALLPACVTTTKEWSFVSARVRLTTTESFNKKTVGVIEVDGKTPGARRNYVPVYGGSKARYCQCGALMPAVPPKYERASVCVGLESR